MGIHKTTILHNPALFSVIENPYTLSFEIESDRTEDSNSEIPIASALKLLSDKPGLSDGSYVRYFVSFDDGFGRIHKTEVSEVIFADFLRTELDNEASRYLYRRYQDMFIDSEQVDKEHAASAVSLEDEFLQREFMRKLYERLSDNLTNTERRRVVMYYFLDMSYSEIAQRDNVSLSTVHESISSAIQKLKKALRE